MSGLGRDECLQLEQIAPARWPLTDLVLRRPSRVQIDTTSLALKLTIRWSHDWVGH
jgi:hypothetical protein